MERRISEFEQLLVQQACSTHLMEIHLEEGYLSKVEYQKLLQSRTMALNSAWNRLAQAQRIHVMELVLVVVDLLMGTEKQPLLYQGKGANSIISGLQMHLPLQYRPLLTFIRRKHMLGLLLMVKHPYAEAKDVRKVRIALAGMITELDGVLLDHEVDLIEELFGIHLAGLDDESLQDKERKEFMKIEQDHQFQREMERVIEGMQALNRKVEPFLPRITPAILHQLSLNERQILKSQTFRTVKYAINPSNDNRMQNLVQSLPSQFSVPYPLDPKSPEVFVPVIGELIANLIDGRSESEIRDSLFDALEQIGTVDGQEHEFFDSRFNVDCEAKTATYLHSPYRVAFKINSLMGGKPFEFEIEKATIELD